ncbi:P1 family peptidase [Microbacterium sp. BWT-B31]|uniref:DmpA family aminopeptidase n=1 Tax=Microbacterium sp. BWT-B31 TaxID=3232072 RepID=UPI0035278AD9
MTASATPAPRVRARDLGIPLGGTPGPLDSITDVPGLQVGYQTITRGNGPLVNGVGPVRTGVTAILPRGRDGVGIPCAAAVHSFNGNGELTGRAWIDESGSLSMPIALTNSHAVGPVHEGVDAWVHRTHPRVSAQWMLPVVGETWDGYLNDINGRHVRPEDAIAALDAATGGPIAEGSVGGGTGMNCYGFKGGSGTASRIVAHGSATYTVGAFIQANFGARDELVLGGIALGRRSSAANGLENDPWLDVDDARARARGGMGSAIIVIATDAPLLPDQCAALARRGPLGMGRTGTTGSHFSGDIVLALSTANAGALSSRIPRGPATDDDYEQLRFVPWSFLDAFCTAVVEAVEESVWNALVAAQDMTGRDDHFSPALPHDEIRAAVARLAR